MKASKTKKESPAPETPAGTSAALNALIVFVNAKIRDAGKALETEEKAHDIAFYQGGISGYRKLLEIMRERLYLEDSFLEDCGEEPEDVSELSDADAAWLDESARALEASDGWKDAESDCRAEEERLKTYLLHRAGCARDLYVAQARYEAVTCWNDVFGRIRSEAAERAERRAKELPFGEEEGAL